MQAVQIMLLHSPTNASQTIKALFTRRPVLRMYLHAATSACLALAALAALTPACSG